MRLGQHDDALRMAGDLQDIFGHGNFFIEIMDHGLGTERRVRSGLLDIARRLDAPIVATADVHYANPAARMTQEMHLRIELGGRWDDPSRPRLDGEGYHLLSGHRMRSLFADIPDAGDNTSLIAERCRTGFHPQPAGSLMPAHDYGPEESTPPESQGARIADIEHALLDRIARFHRVVANTEITHSGAA